MGTFRSIVEVAVGVVFVAGAAFNAVYTLRHAESFFSTWADGAWFGPASAVTREVVAPHARGFTMLLIAFQVVVAASLLARGPSVEPALLAGGTFALVVAFFSSPGGTVGNLGLSGVQYLALLSG